MYDNEEKETIITPEKFKVVDEYRQNKYEILYYFVSKM